MKLDISSIIAAAKLVNAGGETLEKLYPVAFGGLAMGFLGMGDGQLASTSLGAAAGMAMQKARERDTPNAIADKAIQAGATALGVPSLSSISTPEVLGVNAPSEPHYDPAPLKEWQPTVEASHLGDRDQP